MPFVERLKPGRRAEPRREVYRTSEDRKYFFKFIVYEGLNRKGEYGEKIEAVYVCVMRGGAENWVKVRKNATTASVERAIIRMKRFRYQRRARHKRKAGGISSEH